jgi:hypothetical protein
MNSTDATEAGEATRVSLTEMGLWGRRLTVQLGDQQEEVWMQIIGDRTEALERGHEAMQRKLLEFRPGSERGEALTEALMLAPQPDLIAMVLEAERSQMQSRLRREIPDPVTPRRDAAAGERPEDFARRAEEHRGRCAEQAEARAARLEQLLAARREELLARPREELVELARPRRIDVECWNAFARTCDDWVLLRAVRRAEDHEQPYFQQIAEVQALHPEVKEQLRRGYRELEHPEGDALPKFSAATPDSDSTT